MDTEKNKVIASSTPAATAGTPKTFADGVALYRQRGGDDTYLDMLVALIGDAPIEAVTGGLLAHTASVWTKKDGSPAAASTSNRRVFVPAIAVLNCAAAEGWCDRPALRKLKETRNPKLPPPDAWFEAVIPACSPHLAALLLTLDHTGLRISEAVNLRWRDFDIDAGTFLINQTKTADQSQATQLRFVFVGNNPHIMARLTTLPGFHGRDLDARVFGYSDRGSYRNQLRRICRDLDLPYFASHLFGRVSYGTGRLRRGADLKAVQIGGGWASTRMLLERYVRPTEAFVEAEMTRTQRRLATG